MSAGRTRGCSLLEDLPDSDATLTLLFNGFDPKLVLEVAVNRTLRLYFRNRAGTGEVRPYAVRDYLNIYNGKYESSDFSGGAVPRMVVLTCSRGGSRAVR